MLAGACACACVALASPRLRGSRRCVSAHAAAMEDVTLDPIQQNVVGRTCDLCGEVCESTQELCAPRVTRRARAATDGRPPRSNLLDCTFEACSQAECCYHQDCLERYLKSIRCERCVARATGRWPGLPTASPGGLARAAPRAHACRG